MLIENNPDSGKGLGQQDNGASKDEMVGWHHQLNGHKFEQTLGGGAVCYTAVHGITKSQT